MFVSGSQFDQKLQRAENQHLTGTDQMSKILNGADRQIEFVVTKV